jgi:hypothetical protein
MVAGMLAFVMGFVGVRERHRLLREYDEAHRDDPPEA